MICLECGKNYIKKFGIITEKDKIIGQYEICDAEYFECENCKDRMYPFETAKLLDKKRDKILKEKKWKKK